MFLSFRLAGLSLLAVSGLLLAEAAPGLPAEIATFSGLLSAGGSTAICAILLCRTLPEKERQFQELITAHRLAHERATEHFMAALAAAHQEHRAEMNDLHQLYKHSISLARDSGEFQQISVTKRQA